MRLCLVSVAFLALAAPAQATDLNSYRAKHGRAALRVDPSLTGMAHNHALDMARRGRLDHAGFLRGRAPLGAAARECQLRLCRRSLRHRAMGAVDAAPRRHAAQGCDYLWPRLRGFGFGAALLGHGMGGAAPVVRTARTRGRIYLEQATAPRRR